MKFDIEINFLIPKIFSDAIWAYVTSQFVADILAVALEQTSKLKISYVCLYVAVHKEGEVSLFTMGTAD